MCHQSFQEQKDNELVDEQEENEQEDTIFRRSIRSMIIQLILTQ